MGMDLGGGYGAGGAVLGLQQLLAQRQAQRLFAAQQAQQAFENQRQLAADQRAQQGLDLQTQLRNDALAETTRQHDLGLQEHQLTAAHNAADTIPPNTLIGESDAAVPLLQQNGYGSLLTKQAAQPALPNDFQGPLPDGQTRAATPGGYLKTSSAKQQQDATENARKAEVDQNRADYQSGLLDVRGRLADIAGQNADLKAQLADQKANQPPKLGQREQDTVVSIHQMMPMIDELLSGAQGRVQSKGQPSGLLGQLATRAKRAGEVAEYKMGLAQAPDTDKRIQLASLLQILGTVPYLRGIRNMQFVNQIQQHLADPAATDESTIQRLQTLKQILPGMEQAIYDVENKGVIPHAHTGAMDTSKPNAADLIKKYGG